MKQKSFPKKLTLKKETVADLLNTTMENVKGGRTDSCGRTICFLSCAGTCEASVCDGTCTTCNMTLTECQTECPSGGIPCNACI